jgi:acyl-homoserine-lactone acylase
VKKPAVVLLAVLALGLGAGTRAAEPPEVEAWRQRAARVTITRDDWGIPHVAAKTDADAIFGMLYAQAEDDFPRVEANLVNAMGRLAEAEGEAEVYRDLRMKLFVDPVELRRLYAEAPEWLRRDMDAWADGLNFYLHTHPDVKPRVIARFEPWMALGFTEGSIGTDVERVSIDGLAAFYGKAALPAVAGGTGVRPSRTAADGEPTGSNGFAVGPANTASGKALLFINPHTSFFFRHEAQVTSEEGLDAYGASTWGQFFVYQGWNDRLGWMHTSSGADNIDEYALAIVKRADGVYYRYGEGERKLRARTITVPYRSGTGTASREFTVYHSHHGPVVREADGKWIAVRLMNDPLRALVQSFSRTKARDLAAFRAALDLHTNSSNNTVYADADGNIAYFHANFVPRRDPSFDWTKPVDGSDPRTEWAAPHAVDESPNAVNPPGGWIQNTNNWPYSAAGPHSPRRADYPAYFETGVENPRGVHAVRVLDGKKGFTKDSLIAAAFDPQQPAFERLLPGLLAAHEQEPAGSARKALLAGPIEALRAWDGRWDVASVPNTLAVFWGEELWRRFRRDARGDDVYDFLEKTTPAQKLETLAAVVEKLTADFGTWRTPWGEVNRFQRLTPEIAPRFDDASPSTPVGFTSARWGSLAAFNARAYPNTKRWYGTSGNSFVAAVEFGERVSARAVTAGGLSGDPASKHFADQAERYATGNLRHVYFHPDELRGHVVRSYRPGER